MRGHSTQSCSDAIATRGLLCSVALNGSCPEATGTWGLLFTWCEATGILGLFFSCPEATWSSGVLFVYFFFLVIIKFSWFETLTPMLVYTFLYDLDFFSLPWNNLSSCWASKTSFLNVPISFCRLSHLPEFWCLCFTLVKLCALL